MVKMTISLSAEGAARLLAAIQRGELQHLGIVDGWGRETPEPEPIEDDPPRVGSDDALGG